MKQQSDAPFKVGDKVDVSPFHYAGGRWGVVRKVQQRGAFHVFTVKGGTVGDAGLLLTEREITKRTATGKPRGFEHTVSLDEVNKALAELTAQGQGTTMDRPAAILHALRRAIQQEQP